MPEIGIGIEIGTRQLVQEYKTRSTPDAGADHQNCPVRSKTRVQACS